MVNHEGDLQLTKTPINGGCAVKLVVKFGGTCLAGADRIRLVANVIKKAVKSGDRIVAVVSAAGDTTDRLVQACDDALKGDPSRVGKSAIELGRRHFTLASKTIANRTVRRETIETLKRVEIELRNALTGVAYLGELTPRVRDHILSFGERMSAPIVTGTLRSLGIRSSWLTGGEAGIVTDSNFGDASPLMNLTSFQVSSKLNAMLEEGETPVVTGFVACDQKGVITTLGRGGSDLTATLIGSAIRADAVWIWSDVDGLMTADPRIEPSAKTINELSFPEAVELAYFGAKMMHPRALEVALHGNIPVRIRNLFNLKNSGTMISTDKQVQAASIVKAVSLIRQVAVVTVSGARLVGAPGVAARVFDVLGRTNVNVFMITQGSSEANISFAIPRSALDRVMSALELTLMGDRIVSDITCEDDVCIVACVGARMKGTPGVAARLFGAVARHNVNVRMIAQGSSELNISIVVKEQGKDATVRAIHKEFGLG
ncbi:MAG: aspartate kinase [Candidatus Bathyarchaeia archaeon]